MHALAAWPVAILLAGAGVPRAAAAQHLPRQFAVARVDRHADSAARPSPGLRRGLLALPRRDSSWWVPLASTVLPGAGQALLGQDRSVAYLAVEGFALLGFLDQTNAARRERDRYRGLARDIARSAFPGSRPIGPWAYYELMEHYIESGVFDRFPGGEFSPETDQSTSNGAAWLLARQTYWRSPDIEPDHASAEYRRAIAMYIDRAVRPEFRYSWRNAQLEQDLYRRSITQANQAYRDATTQVALLIANHLLATVDAYVTLRLRGSLGAPGNRASLSASLPWAPFGRPRLWLPDSAK